MEKFKGEDRHLHLRDQAPHQGAEQDQEGRGGRVDDDNHQGDGGGGGDGHEQRVGDGQEQVKSGRKPVKWVVLRRRGIVPDGMVQTRHQNFAVKFPNLGMMGSCNQTGVN
jgi:hypothetical protein